MQAGRQGPEPLSWRGRALAATVLILVLLAILEGAGALLMSTRPEYETVRGLLRAGDARQIIHVQNTISQPYLLYIPAPRFAPKEHNRDGYRGPRVPLGRRDGVLRVLFLGGSTTYGWRVEHARDTYPAQLGRLLRARLPAGYRDVEVINGGLPFGTSAEILTHYAFKYRYYRPHVVVINTGGNDGVATERHNYQPDYSHWRQTLPAVRPLREEVRWILASRFVSYWAVHLFFSDLATGQHFIRPDSRPPVRWYPQRERQGDGPLQLPDGDLAFTNNLRAVIREVRGDGGSVLLVPFRRSGNPDYGAVLRAEMDRNESELLALAAELDVVVAPFPHGAITYEHWVDACHVDAAGSEEKARHIEPFLRDVIASRKAPAS